MRGMDYVVKVTLRYKNYTGTIFVNIQSDYRKIHALDGAVKLLNHGQYKPDMTFAWNRMYIDVDSRGYVESYVLHNRDGDNWQFEFGDVGGYVVGLELVDGARWRDKEC